MHRLVRAPDANVPRSSTITFFLTLQEDFNTITMQMLMNFVGEIVAECGANVSSIEIQIVREILKNNRG